MVNETINRDLRRSEISHQAKRCRQSGCQFVDLCWHTGSCLLPAQSDTSLGSRMRVMTELDPGDHAYRISDPFLGFVAVRTGWLKIYHDDEDGTEQVLSFVAGGELAGLEGLDKRVHNNSAVALCTTSCCLLEIEDFAEVCQNQSEVLQKFLTLFGTVLRKQEFLAGNYTAIEKLSAFLMEIFSRSVTDPSAAQTFTPAMTHGDMANYLSIAPETLSRLFRRLIRMNLVEHNGKQLVILDPQGLGRVADGALH